MPEPSSSPSRWLVLDERVLATVEVADTHRDRTRGLLGRDGLEGALLLRLARSVHPFGLLFRIDEAHLEDDRIVRETAVDMLSNLGYRTTVAGNLEQAKTELDTAAIDLLFTDYILPNGNTGDDVAAYAQKVKPDIAILYTSGYPRDKLKQDMSLSGNVTLIAKPFQIHALASAVRQVLDARRGHRVYISQTARPER